MNPILRNVRRTLAVLLLATLSTPAIWASGWTTDFSAAISEAKRDGKLVLLDFTGSDWCGWCIKLQNEVFAKPEFQKYAEQKLVLVEVDFPRGKPISQALKDQNEQLAQRFGVKGFPTLVVLDPDGRELGRTGYRPGGPPGLIAELDKLRQTALPKLAQAKPASEAPAPLWKAVPVIARSKPKIETEVRLKGISGVPGRRMALINGETMGPGDEVRVPVGEKMIRVHCLEVKEASAVVHVNGEEAPRELFLKK